MSILGPANKSAYQHGIRRIISIATKRGALDILHNIDVVSCTHWDWSVSIGPVTVAFVVGV